jgi:hypothetical protein
MSKTKRTDSYVFTADPQSVADMQQIDIVKKTVKAINLNNAQSYKYACRTAEYRGEPLPKKPSRLRVRLMGRGPRRVHANLKYGGRYNNAYDAYLPQKHATHFDIYIANVR